MLAKQKELDR